MDLEREFSLLRREEARERRIERAAPQCLSFAELERAAGDPCTLPAGAGRHLTSCDRCSGLLRAFRRTAAGPVRPNARTTRVVLSCVAAVAAAALFLVWLVPRLGSRPPAAGSESAGISDADSPDRVASGLDLRSPLARVFGEGEAGGLLEDLLTRELAASEPVLDPVREVAPGVELRRAGVRGARFFGFCNTDPPEGYRCDATDCRGREASLGSPCDDRTAVARCKESRMTLEIYTASALAGRVQAPGAEPPLLVLRTSLAQGAPTARDPGSPRALAVSLARQGIPVVLFDEVDRLPAGGTAVPPLFQQFGFASPAELRLAGMRWMMLRGEALAVEDLRFDPRFAHAQEYLLATTFFQSLLREAGESEFGPWLSRLRVCYAADTVHETGASGADAGCVTAGGIDPRAAAVLVGGTGGLTDGPDSAYHRFESDWSLCGSRTVNCSDPRGLEEVGPWGEFSSWAWRTRDDVVSYFDAYHPARDPSRYEDLWFLEVVATHNGHVPLGSLASNGFDVRRVVRINRDRSVPWPAGEERGRPVSASELLLRHALDRLRAGGALPPVDLVRADTTSSRRWRVQLRVGDDDRGATESLTLHVAFSDDRDFRRCAAPIVCAADGSTCEDHFRCADDDRDDNKDEEDRFISVPIDPSDLVRSGDLREIAFVPPRELHAFARPPIVAVVAEVRFAGPDPESVLDDYVLFTDVMFVGADRYPAFECPN